MDQKYAQNPDETLGNGESLLLRLRHPPPSLPGDGGQDLEVHQLVAPLLVTLLSAYIQEEGVGCASTARLLQRLWHYLTKFKYLL